MYVPFQPIGATIEIVAASTGKTMTLAAIDATIAPQVRVEAIGTGGTTLVFGGAASTGGMGMNANSVEVFSRGSETTVSVLASSGTQTVRATVGRSMT